MKSVLGNFLLDFNRLLKNILKRPQQTATTTIFKGNPPKQTKNTKIQKKVKKKKMSGNTRQKNVTFNQRSNPFYLNISLLSAF